MNKLVEVAISQVGYWNKATNSQLDSNTANKKYGYNGYTKYGAWYGMNPSAWCGIFVSWCGNEAGCLNEVGGKIAYVPYYISTFNNRGRWHKRGSYFPKSGDLIIFEEWNSKTKEWDECHVGIVEDSYGGVVFTIEGNANGGCVSRNKYDLNSTYIMGYCETKIGEDYFPDIKIKQGIYKNGSTPETVYADSDCSDALKIGEINRYESCTKIGTCGDKTMVIYPVDGTKKYKIGFVKYGGS